MGRTLNITIHSARELLNADGDELGQTDAFVVVCFDGDVNHELGRTEIAPETTNPEWEYTFEADVSKQIETIVEETGAEPEKLTFCLYDGDETQVEPLGIAGVDFSDLVKEGKFDGDLPIVQGSGIISVTVEMKKAKIGSMFKDSAALKIAGGVAGVAALGALGAYLYKRQEKKKAKISEAEGEENVRTGLEYGANVDDDDDDDEDKDNLKKWWEMDDEAEDDEPENRWESTYTYA